MSFIKDVLKITLGWIVGVTGYEFFMSQWQNDAMDWNFITNFIIAGFLGILIGRGFKKKDKS